MTDLKPEDLARLRDIAEKATPGEWHAGHFADDDHPCNCDGVVSEVYMGSVATVSASNGLPVSEGGNDSPPPEEAKANLRHIAAFSPSVCLSLLADRARMEKALAVGRTLADAVRLHGYPVSDEHWRKSSGSMSHQARALHLAATAFRQALDGASQ